MAKKKTEYDKCWVVTNPDHGRAYVIADNWEQATVKAAEFWGVKWRDVAFFCDLEKTMEARRGVCARCRRIIYSNRELCENCEREEEQARKRMRDTWYLGRKGDAFGT